MLCCVHPVQVGAEGAPRNACLYIQFQAQLSRRNVKSSSQLWGHRHVADILLLFTSLLDVSVQGRIWISITSVNAGFKGSIASGPALYELMQADRQDCGCSESQPHSQNRLSLGKHTCVTAYCVLCSL